MQKLDTHTVLEIIKMIDVQIHNLEQAEDIWQEEEHFGVKHLSLLQDHLQSYIEGLLNTAENASADEEYYGEGHCPNCGGLIDLHGPDCAEE